MSLRFRMAVLIAGALAAPAALRAQAVPEIYQVDQAHAAVGFTVRLVGFNRVRGTFQRFEGHLIYEPQQVERGSISFSIDVRSVDTGNEQRDEHLRSDAFFDAGRFPAITFRSTRVEAGGPGLLVTGDLTIRDVTRPVQIPVELVSADAADPFGNRRVAFAARLSLNRRDYGVVGPAFWNNAISDNVDIELEIPGRIWNYSRLGMRPTSIGRYLLARRDTVGMAAARREARAFWDQPNRDSLHWFGTFDFQVAAGKLAQANQVADALSILQLGSETAGTRSPDDASWLLALRAQLEGHLGRRRDAASSVAQALQADSTNTLALELQRALGRP